MSNSINSYEEFSIECGRALDIVAAEYRDYSLGFAIGAYNHCESPIESKMLTGLIDICIDARYPLSIRWDNIPFNCWDIGRNDGFWEGHLIQIFLQPAIGKYRADMKIRMVQNESGEPETNWVIIECDGHDFHERTKLQAQHDKKRDRTMQSMGYQVLRFTGSEIHNSIDNCTLEILTHLLSLIK